jgi:hypothetical protein
MSVWVYILGERNGDDIKVGHSKAPTLRKRIALVNNEQTTDASYVLLAAVNATTKDEECIKDYFSTYRRTDKGNRTEYFHPAEELVEYTNWLRSQWWSTVDVDTPRAEAHMEAPDNWLPDTGRRIAPPPHDDLKLIQDYEDPTDGLYNTAWSWMSSQKAGVQDYFTPPEIVDAARTAMGGIDLDAASHPLANRTHRIPDYFHTGRSAFDNDWHGRVWLNPPYGNNAPWFDRILHFVVEGAVEQLCMLSPMWAFQTQLSRPVMEIASGLILFSPTPKFWGNKDPNKTGRNDPHGVIYIGPNEQRFYQAFAPFGFPMKPAWADVEFVPEGEAA